jgi:hypothetical protein
MKLYNNEIHIIAPTEIKTVFDLEGKRIEAPKDQRKVSRADNSVAP